MLMTFYINRGQVFNYGKKVWVLKPGRCEDLIENRINRWGDRYEGEDYNKDGKFKVPQKKWLINLKTICSIEVFVNDHKQAEELENTIRMYKKDIWLEEGRDYPLNVWLDGMTEICRWSEHRENNMISKMKQVELLQDIPF